MRLIDADALTERTEAIEDVFVTNWTTEKVQRLIHDAPTIDAVPVIRCKDCEHCLDRKTYLRCVRNGFNNGYEVEPTDFCSHGERRQNL